jgi:hypothetical protein
MRKLIALAAGLALSLGGAALADAQTTAAGAGAGGPVSESGAPAAQLVGYLCQRNLQPRLRGVSVTAVMRPVAGTRHMRLRFELLASQRRIGPYQAVFGPNLERWVSPADPRLGTRPGDVWQVPHPIVGLNAPAFYKIRVRFRWLDRSGHSLAQRVLVSAICHQLELRPDLVAQSLTITPAAVSGDDAYLAAIADQGLTGAGPFDVQLGFADGTFLTRHVLWLGRQRTRTIRFVAPSCVAGSAVTLTVDPSAQIDDYNRANNVLTLTCPAG